MSNSSTPIVLCDDGDFGPVVRGCRHDFDFTLSFEQYIFSAAPAAIFLLAAAGRMVFLRRKPAKVDGAQLKIAKMVAISIFTILQVVQIVLWASLPRPDSVRTPALIGSALSLTAGLVLGPLSYIEHVKSLRPSLVASAYLSVSLVLDIATLRTFWLSSSYPSRGTTIAAVFTASFAVKLAVLILEAVEKSNFFLPGYRHRGPEEAAGLFSQGFLWWLNPIIWFGARHLLAPKDLYPVAPDMASEYLVDRFWLKWTGDRPRGRFPLPRALVGVLWRPLLAPVLPRLALIALTLCQPLLMRRVLEYLQDTSAEQNENVGRGLIGGAALVYMGMAITSAVYWHRHHRFVAMIRGVLMTTIFQVATRTRIEAAQSSQIVTHMSTDCEQVVRGFFDLHELWANLAQVAIATWLVERELGVACVAPIVVTIVTMGLTAYSAKLTPGLQIKWLDSVQSRIATTSPILGSMRAIKISNLASKAYTMLKEARRDELAAAKRFRLLAVFSSTVAYSPRLLTPVIAFGVFISVGRSTGAHLDPARMFTSLSLLLLLAEPLFSLFKGIFSLMQALGCLQRMEKFLQAPLPKERRVIRDSPRTASGSSADDDSCITVRGGSFGWSENGAPVLRNLDFAVRSGELVVVLGPVASGKSTLLKAILGETPLFEGSVELEHADISFCDQSPWLMNASIRSNIIGYSIFDPELFRKVTEACDLGPDLSSLPNGDGTVVGSKGFALSAGQRQRVALARCVYSRKRIAILDDVLSHLDATTQSRILGRLFSSNGLFRGWGTTVVLTMSSPRRLSYADRILLLDDTGRLVNQGNYEDLKSELNHVETQLHEPSQEATGSTTVDSDDVDVIVEARRGSDKDRGVPASTDLSEQKQPVSGTQVEEKGPQLAPEIIKAARKARQSSDLSVYRFYFDSVDRKIIAVFFVFQICLGFLDAFPYVWLQWWSEENVDNFPNQQTDFFMGIYGLLQALAVLAQAAVTWWSLAVLSVNSGFALHDKLATTVISAKLKLFSSTDSGSILNRFTQDLQLADLQLPLALQVVATTVLICVAKAGLVASATGWIAISFPFLMTFFYAVTKYYTRTSRQIRYLDLEQKAPVYGQFLETLEGIVSIRAFSWTHASTRKNCALVDASQQPHYLMYVIQKWLGLVLDVSIAGLATLVVGLGIALRGRVSKSGMGMALVQVVTFTGYLKMLVLFFAQLQTCMAAIERIRDFGNETEKEGEEDGDGENSSNSRRELNPDWPGEGNIEIRNLYAKYGNDDNYVLSDVSLSIKPGEKVCICGRTGSGKSSLILALLRLLDPSTGTISISDTDITSIPRSVLRARIAGVAEEPFLFPGTVRHNMNPYDDPDTDDAAIIRALADVNVWTALESRGGLDAKLEKDMLSHGQRQLFAIARVIVRDTQVVVFDEATTSLDTQTEKLLVEKVIENRLKHRTVIWVAHKLHHAHKFDKVVVLGGDEEGKNGKKGRVVEVGAPAELLARPSSAFRSLLESSHG